MDKEEPFSLDSLTHPERALPRPCSAPEGKRLAAVQITASCQGMRYSVSSGNCGGGGGKEEGRNARCNRGTKTFHPPLFILGSRSDPCIAASYKKVSAKGKKLKKERKCTIPVTVRKKASKKR